MSRASTLLLALLILNTLLGALCLAVSRGERKSRALELWGWGLLLYSAGILITIPAALPFHFRKVLGNGLITLAPVLTVAGMLRYTSLRLHRRWLIAGVIASVAVLVINHFGPHYSVLVDMLAPSPLANILFITAAVALIRVPPPDAKTAARFVAGILLFSVAVWSFRMVAIWTSIGSTNDRERADLTIALFSIAQMVVAVASTLGLLWIEVRNMEAALRRLADSDMLTGLPNRRATVRHFVEEAARATRHRRSFGLLLLDVDHFKRINDTYGHLAGDVALRHVGAVLSSQVREVDTVGRIGGEEFVVVLGEQDSTGAVIAANRIRETLATAEVDLTGERAVVTVSGGLAMYPADGSDWDALFAAADQRLYAAKAGGRNRIAAAT